MKPAAPSSTALTLPNLPQDIVSLDLCGRAHSNHTTDKLRHAKYSCI